MTLLTRDNILKVDDLPHEIIEVPEWGGEVRVQGLSGAARDAYDRSLVDADGKYQQEDFKTKLVALSLTDESGTAIFSIDDVKNLRTKSAAALQRVFEVADRLSKVSVASLEETEKN